MGTECGPGCEDSSVELEREVRWLQRAAVKVEADLRRALGGEWSCRVDDAFILTLAGPAGTESLLLDDVSDNYFHLPEDHVSPEDLEGWREEDAHEAVATESLEALRALGVDGPRCRVHDQPLEACCFGWTCPEGHDGPLIGELGKGP